MKRNATNYHSHCSFCDGKAPLEEFVKAAVAAGFSAYGVSSHAPLPFQTRWTLDKEQVPAYLEEISRLKQAYKDRIELYAGMEIDYLHGEQHAAIPYFQQLPLDYRIGSVHLVYTPEGKIVDTDTKADTFRQICREDFGGNLKALVSAYFEASMRMVEKGGFDFVGHVNKIAYNAEQCEEGVTEQAWYTRKLEDLFACIAEKGMIVEINTKGYADKGCFFPDIKNWRYLKQWNIPLVVNSDAHFPERINSGRDEALKLLQEAGFRSVRQLMGGKWQDVEIG